MPRFAIPTMASAVFNDGSPIAPGDTCFPVLVLVDSNGKIVQFTGPDIVVPAPPGPSSVAPSPSPSGLAGLTGPGSGGSGGT